MAAALCSRQYVHVHYVCGCARASWAGMRAKCREYCCNAGGQQALLGGWACTLRRLPARSSQMPRRLTPPVQPLAWLFLAAVTARPVHWISTLPNSPPSKPYPLAASRPSRRLSFSRPSPSARALLALANCSALADKLYSSISHDSLVNTMILRESESNNMGRGAYDTTGTPKPSPTTTPPTK
ncbi:hypothetical protein COCSADRAFT_193287 [Bipolaris sorokiniana ND90Pr]|uniref:Uncharacterized protein n=1 Tax=Cochliobolus sativus (strain ND90Pr / ATCC 201652) TaxID=665912 RepID=M2S042_COCSN|nr:uncharacterized protein COCSADRAFT_193287 [Bipolaris sorokiniana ND90Pr]EMD60628.1 hypothetical protein COCSADRAFT_193287 [Bipolaris sorokiniana ND90Pr]